MNTIQYEYLYVLDGNKTLKPNYLKVNKPVIMNTIQYEYLYVLDGNKTLKPNYLKVNKPNILTERVIFGYKRSI